MPLTLQFTIDAREEDKLPQIIGRINSNFQVYLNEADDNRTISKTGQITRKPIQEYQGKTIVNTLSSAFDTAGKHDGVLETMTPRFVRFAGRVYGPEHMPLAELPAGNPLRRKHDGKWDDTAPGWDDVASPAKGHPATNSNASGLELPWSERVSTKGETLSRTSAGK